MHGPPVATQRKSITCASTLAFELPFRPVKNLASCGSVANRPMKSLVTATSASYPPRRVESESPAAGAFTGCGDAATAYGAAPAITAKAINIVARNFLSMLCLLQEVELP